MSGPKFKPGNPGASRIKSYYFIAAFV